MLSLFKSKVKTLVQLLWESGIFPGGSRGGTCALKWERRGSQYGTVCVSVSWRFLLQASDPWFHRTYWEFHRLLYTRGGRNLYQSPATICRGLFLGVFNFYTCKLYFKLIWQLRVIPRAERLGLPQQGELHKSEVCWREVMQEGIRVAFYRFTARRRQW